MIREAIQSGAHNSPNFASVLERLTVRDFCVEYFGKKTLYIEGNPDKFQGLLGWLDITHLLDGERFDEDQVFLSRHGQQISLLQDYPQQRSPSRHPVRFIDVTEVNKRFRDGYSLVCNDVGRFSEPTRRLCADIEKATGYRSWVNGYISPNTSTVSAFGLHWDDHDVLILQLEGSKKWEVYETTNDHPLNRKFDQPEDPTKLAWSGCLNKGDVLYIPRGAWHDVSGSGDCSLHVTIGIKADSARDFLDWAVGELTKQRIVRMDIPWFDEPAKVNEYVTELGRLVADAMSIEWFEEFRAHQLAQLPRRPEFSFPWCLKQEDPAEPRDSAETSPPQS